FFLCDTALGPFVGRFVAGCAGPGNASGPTPPEVGLTPRRLEPLEFREVLDYGLGLTDLCKTRSGSDAEVGTDGFDVPRLEALAERYAPEWLAFTSKTAARHALGPAVSYGEQPHRFGPSRVYVLPSPSARARRYWDIEPWRELARLSLPRRQTSCGTSRNRTDFPDQAEGDSSSHRANRPSP
ncbi:MAG: mismatch-specific DNA-glycosylase, partial [Solirubrobacterales bacterium]